jgi:hypothetical protein
MSISGPFEYIVKYMGLSTDTKPITVSKGSAFYETDTGLVYLFDGTTWYVTEEMRDV